MLEGKRFFALIGMPIRNSDLAKMLFADWLPVPLTVATSIERSFTVTRVSLRAWGIVRVSGGFMEVVFARFTERGRSGRTRPGTTKSRTKLMLRTARCQTREPPSDQGL